MSWRDVIDYEDNMASEHELKTIENENGSHVRYCVVISNA